MFCPHCGANQLASPAPAAAGGDAAPDERPDSPDLSGRLRAVGGALAAVFTNAAPFGDDSAVGSYESIDEERVAQRSRLPLYAGGVVAVVIFAVGVYMMLPSDHWQPRPGIQVIQGSVGTAPQIAPPVPRGAPQADGFIAPRRDVPVTGPVTRPAANPPGAPINAPVAAGHAAPSAKPNAPPRVDVPRQLAIARANLARSSLWPARRAIQNVLAAQPGNGEAQRMRADLVSRERQRDSALNDARFCARGQEWACVRETATKAASIDTSSRDAKRLIAQAVRQELAAARSADPGMPAWLRRWVGQPPDARASAPRTPQMPPWQHP